MFQARVTCADYDVPDAPDPDESVAACGPRREAAVLADVARCPVCRVPMQPRMGRRGPYVHCLCAERQGNPP
jgi:hypothetical protein